MSYCMIRKPVAAEGQPTEFKFKVCACSFLIKNMTEGNIFVAFGKPTENKDDMILIRPNSWQRHECRLPSGNLDSADTVYVIGTGGPGDGVEVECLKW